jgi:hypothetical protein
MRALGFSALTFRAAIRASSASTRTWLLLPPTLMPTVNCIGTVNVLTSIAYNGSFDRWFKLILNGGSAATIIELSQDAGKET